MFGCWVQQKNENYYKFVNNCNSLSKPPNFDLKKLFKIL